jgi:hypothetical protein
MEMQPYSSYIGRLSDDADGRVNLILQGIPERWGECPGKRIIMRDNLNQRGSGILMCGTGGLPHFIESNKNIIAIDNKETKFLGRGEGQEAYPTRQSDSLYQFS